MNVTIESPLSTDSLQQERWTFYVDTRWHGVSGIAVVFNSYELLQRPTTRHKLRVQKSWERLRGRLAYKTDFEPLDRPPEVPEDVVARARAKVVEAITFVLKPE